MPVKYDKDGEPYIDPAKLREPITFLASSQGTDVSGAVVTWAAAVPPDIAYSEIVPIRAADVIKGGQDVSSVWSLATIRYVAPGRQATERFRDSSNNVYIIEAVENHLPGRKVYQELTCLLVGNNV